MQDSPLSVFLEKSGYTGNDAKNVGDQTISGRLAILLIGSNGLALDPQGRLIITAMTDRTVVRLERDGTRTILAGRYDGKRFNGPNDVAVKSDGAIYFTDTVFGMRGGADSLNRDHPGEFPNGIALSPDEKVLYVTAGFGKTMRYDVMADDTVANGALFIPAGNDGMKTDTRGNLYSTNAVGPGEIWVTSKEGKHLGTLQLPQPLNVEPKPRIVPTNVAFGDPDGRSLYITACTHLFRIRLKTAGTVARTGIGR
jgi:gluconolactonase